MSRSWKKTFIVGGTSPLVSRQKIGDIDTTDSTSCFARRSLKSWGRVAQGKWPSHEEIRTESTKHRIGQYNGLAREKNADGWRNKSNNAWHKFHMRVGYNKKGNNSACENDRMCDEVALRPDLPK